MADNLTISIGADTSKARHEMELLNAEMRKTQKEIKATADQAVKTGDPKAIERVKTLTAAMTGMNKQFVVLKKEVNGANKELNAFHQANHGHHFYLVEQSLQNLNGALMAVGHNISGRTGAIAGFAVGIAFTKLGEMVDEATKKMMELKKTANEIGIRPAALRATQQIAREAGQDADDATKIQQGLGKVIEDNRRKFGAPVGGGPGMPTILRGSDPSGAFIGTQEGPPVTIFRGGQPNLPADPTQALAGFDPRQFPANAKGMEQAILALQKKILELSKTMNAVDFNVFARQFGVSGEALRKNAEVEIPKLIARIKELEGPTNKAISNAEALAASEGKLATSFDAAMDSMMAKVVPARIFINEQLAAFFDESAFSANLADAAQKWSTFWEDLKSTAASAGAAIKNTLSSIGSAAASALSNAGNAISDAAQQGAIPGVFARGGYVTGPGTGTSDSILARLSAGEYVVNAASVRRAGLGFLQQLNGFAAGGLVGKFPRFAEGGLVAAGAGGGSPVHLHLGNAEYITSASPAVAGALVIEARRQQMRSAGIKPSWYGGRPGA